MTKGRKPQTLKAEVPASFNEEATRSSLNSADKLSNMGGIIEDALRLGRAMGQFETASFYQTISDSVKLSAFDEAKKSKAYLQFINPKTQTYFGSLEEFCEVRLGVGYERMRQVSSNRNLLGQELFEQAEQLGLRNIDYKALRALPADEQAFIKQAIEQTKSRDEVLDLLQEMAARHHHEREDMTKKVTELEATAEATEKIIESKDAKLNEMDKKLRKSHRTDPWPEDVDDFKNDLHGIGKHLDALLSQSLTNLDVIELETDKYAEAENTTALTAYKTVIHQFGAHIERLCTLAAGLRNEFETRLGCYVELDKTLTLPE